MPAFPRVTTIWARMARSKAFDTAIRAHMAE